MRIPIWSGDESRALVFCSPLPRLSVCVLTPFRCFRSGKWAQIKAHYGIELADRSAINIKDRWRTLKKLGLN